jgi:hypothetical protein
MRLSDIRVNNASPNKLAQAIISLVAPHKLAQAI